jgi:hypothetical protein
MQWLRLKIWLIPAIMQEVDTVTIYYISNELSYFKRYDQPIEKR